MDIAQSRLSPASAAAQGILAVRRSAHVLLVPTMAHPVVAGLVAQEQLDPVQGCYERCYPRPLQLVRLPLRLLRAEGVTCRGHWGSGCKVC